MPIQVTCPSCLKRFQVSDKFAGKEGPCPNCKKPLRVPDKSEEVVIHAPEDDSPKDSQGRSVLKPISRKDEVFTRKHALITFGAVLGGVVAAVALRLTSGDDGPPWWTQVLGMVLLAPPLVRVGYNFVRDAELAPYVGPELRNRVLLCSGLFAALWLLYAFVPSYVGELNRFAEMSVMAAGIMFFIMLGIGAAISVMVFELEFANGMAHAGIYLIVVAALALLAGVPMAGIPTEPVF